MARQRKADEKGNAAAVRGGEVRRWRDVWVALGWGWGIVIETYTARLLLFLQCHSHPDSEETGDWILVLWYGVHLLSLVVVNWPCTSCWPLHSST